MEKETKKSLTYLGKWWTWVIFNLADFKAAELLGIDEKTLYNKLKEYKIS